MNRRGFFKALVASALIAVASRTRLAETVVHLSEDYLSIGRRYTQALAEALTDTKEMLIANMINKTFGSIE